MTVRTHYKPYITVRMFRMFADHISEKILNEIEIIDSLNLEIFTIHPVQFLSFI